MTPVSNLDLSDASQFDTLIGYVRQEVVEIESFGLDVERQTAVLVAKVRYSFPRNGGEEKSTLEQGCVARSECEAGTAGEEIKVAMLFVFGRQDCLIEEVVVIPSRKEYLVRELEEVNGRIPTTNFCFKDCRNV